MATIADVVRPMLNAHGETHWKVGIVLVVGADHTLTVQFIGAASGQGTPGVGYLDSYVPKVNDIVHALMAETRGALVLGSTGTAPPNWMDPPPPPPPVPAVPDAVSDPARSGTMIHTENGPWMQHDHVRQGRGHLGMWSMTGLDAAIRNARALGVIVLFEIELKMVSDGVRAVLALVSDKAGVPVISAPEHRSAPLVKDVPTRVALPIGWLDPLEARRSVIGLTNSSAVQMTSFDLSASVYLTVERYDS